MNVKLEILRVIYNAFEEWSRNEARACRQGCAACCTRAVTITGLEAELILDHVVQEGHQGPIGTILARELAVFRPYQTINGFAAACLAGEDTQLEEQSGVEETCPFLDNTSCTIYPARPFGCRSFLSHHTCTPHKPAVISEAYLAGCTVTSQLIEHLGQREYYGNMFDVLWAILDNSAYQEILEHAGDRGRIHQARSRTLTARPLPGFLLDQEGSEAVAPLLESIFCQQVDSKSIEDILNGR